MQWKNKEIELCQQGKGLYKELKQHFSATILVPCPLTTRTLALDMRNQAKTLPLAVALNHFNIAQMSTQMDEGKRTPKIPPQVASQ